MAEMNAIADVRAIEILDSRGRPTVQTTLRLASGAVGTVSVPSGASTGTAEAHELRDGDAGRYGGLGCLQAVAHVNGPIRNLLVTRPVTSQADLDAVLNLADGTATKSNMGANAILSVSLAWAVWPSCQRNSVVRRNSRVRSSHRITLHH